jgi:sugar lactone lactonase YvrE
MIFNADGTLRGSFGAAVLADPHGIEVTSDNRVLVVDRDSHQIVAFNTEGEELFRLGKRHQPCYQKPFNHPTDIVQASNGDFYVSDGYGNAAVHWFSSDGAYRKSWGQPGAGPGEFMWPHGICLDSKDRVLVADLSNNRIQLFSLEGDYLGEWGNVDQPTDLFATNEGFVFVADETTRVTMLDSDGVMRGRCRPCLYCGHGIAAHTDGTIYLAESSPVNRITRLKPVDSKPADSRT